MSKAQGLYHKFDIKRTDGKDIPEQARLFDLRIDNDKIALGALIHYATAIDNQRLLDDLQTYKATLEVKNKKQRR